MTGSGACTLGVGVFVVSEFNLADGIADELAGLVGAHLATMKGFVKSLGSPITTQKYWLDVDFPDGPPQEYERGGYDDVYTVEDVCQLTYIQH